MKAREKGLELLAAGILKRSDFKIIDLLGSGLKTKNQIRNEFPNFSGAMFKETLAKLEQHNLIVKTEFGYKVKE